MSLRILKELRHRYRQFLYEPDNPIDEDIGNFFSGYILLMADFGVSMEIASYGDKFWS